jgi:FlaA1/EpsC-like NDP-sugar epimerase
MAMTNLHLGRNILVTGAGGWIGSALSKALIRDKPRKLILLDHSERSLYHIDAELKALHRDVAQKSILGDVCDAKLLDEIFELDGPEIVYHAAAYKHVPLLENNPIAAIRNNALGTNTLVEAAERHGVSSLVMISTDKAVEASSILGASKRVAELALMRWDSPGAQMRALRLGNVLASEGSVVPLFQRQISQGGPVTVTHPDAKRYFVPLEKALELILLAARLPGGGGIFAPDLGSPVRIVDLAAQLITELRSTNGAEVPILYTALRPGDKKTEKMCAEREWLEATTDSRLSRVRTNENCLQQYDVLIGDLARGVEERDLASLLEVLRKLVPEYNPSEELLALRENPAARI